MSLPHCSVIQADWGVTELGSSCCLEQNNISLHSANTSPISNALPENHEHYRGGRNPVNCPWWGVPTCKTWKAVFFWFDPKAAFRTVELPFTLPREWLYMWMVFHIPLYHLRCWARSAQFLSQNPISLSVVTLIWPNHGHSLLPIFVLLWSKVAVRGSWRMWCKTAKRLSFRQNGTEYLLLVIVAKDGTEKVDMSLV